MGQIDSHPIQPLTKTYFQKTPRLNRVDNTNRKKYVEKNINMVCSFGLGMNDILMKNFSWLFFLN